MLLVKNNSPKVFALVVALTGLGCFFGLESRATDEPKSSHPVQPIEIGIFGTDGSSQTFQCNLKSAVKNCARIVVAEYTGLSSSKSVSFDDPPMAHYRLVSTLKGPQLNADFSIWYQFHDGSSTTDAPRDWHFDSTVMPVKGSKWILFIMQRKRGGAFDTYRGSFGRHAYSKAEEHEIKESIKEE